MGEVSTKISKKLITHENPTVLFDKLGLTLLTAKCILLVNVNFKIYSVNN